MQSGSQVDRDSPTADRLGRPPALAAFEVDLAMRSVMASVIGRIRDVEIGRYRIKQRLGQGGCGLVLLAEDPELGREVAIKVVLPARSGGTGSTWQRALQREAQALAKLRHPNVVEVFDAGLTDSGDDDLDSPHLGVYVVMERLAGRTLRQWIERAGAARQPWREIVRIHLEAARGLAAAHAVGIVHRDFKPDNVMLTDDGRVVLIDFGLADLAEDLGAAASVTATMPVATTTGDSRTSASQIVGTPAYMAPEQHDGREVTAAADQFAWCASLFSGLFGAPPFTGATMGELAAAKRHGRISVEAHGPARRLLRVLRRGLAAHPADRYPDMDGLLRAVERATDGAARWPWLAGAAATLAVAGSAAAGLGPQHPCDADSRAAGSGWSPDRRDEIDRAVASLPDPHAVATAALVGARLDEHARGWDEALRGACTTAGADAAVEAQLACLDRAAEQLDQVATAFTELDVEHIGNVGALLESLRDPASCADAPQPSAEHREELARLWQRADEIGVGVDAVGKIADVDAARADLARAQELGDAGLASTLAWRLSQVDRAAARFEDAAESLRTAVFQATAAHDFERALELMDHLVLVVGADLGDHDEAMRMAEHARSMAENLDDPRPALASLENALAYVFINAGKRDEAVAAYRRALATFERLGKPSTEYARTLLALAGWASEERRDDERLAYLTRAREILDEVALPTDPNYAALAFNDASLAADRGDHAAAARGYREAVDRLRPRLHGHPYIAIALNALALAEATRGRFDEALAAEREAVEIATAASGAAHRDSVLYNAMLGQIAWSAGDDDAAREAVGVAIESMREVADAEDLVGVVHHLAAWVAVGRGDRAAAEASFAVARATVHGGSPPGIDEARSVRRLAAMIAVLAGDAAGATAAMSEQARQSADGLDVELERELDARTWDRIVAIGGTRPATQPASDPAWRPSAGDAVIFGAMARAILGKSPA